MTEREHTQQSRVDSKIEEIKRVYGEEIASVLKVINRTRLKNKGKFTATPVVENNCLRWTLAWKEQQKISFELHVVIGIEDDGHAARVGRVWIHRHASTPIGFEGHTPTTRMRRLTTLSMDGIREAIDAEWS